MLDRNIRAQLQEALAHSFPNLLEARKLLTDAGVVLTRVLHDSADPRAFWHAALDEAELNGRETTHRLLGICLLRHPQLASNVAVIQCTGGDQPTGTPSHRTNPPLTNSPVRKTSADPELLDKPAQTTPAGVFSNARQYVRRSASRAGPRKRPQEQPAKVEAPAQDAGASPNPPSLELTNSLGMKLILISPGTFRMGSSARKSPDNEKPARQVTLTRAFYIGQTLVTQQEWLSVMGSNPSHFKGPDHPVECVSWRDATEFVDKLNAREGGAFYRLATEAEWEYAACAAGLEDFPQEHLVYRAWYNENSNGTTHPVRTRRSNSWNIHDLLGNVWEWVQDWYGPYLPEQVLDPRGPDSGREKTLRGGSWKDARAALRAVTRCSAPPETDASHIGFRVVRLVSEMPASAKSAAPLESGVTPGTHKGDEGTPAPASPDAAVPPEERRDELYLKISRLIPAQFDDLVAQLNVQRHYLSSSQSPQTTRAAELLTLCEQRPDGLVRLERILRRILA